MNEHNYPIIANCNFESRDDEAGKAIHAARKAVEAGLTDDDALVSALDELEETLREHADSQYVDGIEACREAEAAVVAAWRPSVQEEVEVAIQTSYRD